MSPASSGATCPSPRRDGRLSIDIGCGPNKKPGSLGLDIQRLPGVDYVVDFTRERLPFDDSTVDDIHSSHCIEHLPDPIHLFKEMTRVARHGASLEIWVPHGWHDSAFLWDHRTVWTEAWFTRVCHTDASHWQPALGARWRLRHITFVVDRKTILDLNAHGVSVGFALRHGKNVCWEMGVSMEVDKESSVPRAADPPGPLPPRYYTLGRDLPKTLVSAHTPASRYFDLKKLVRGLLRPGSR